MSRFAPGGSAAATITADTATTATTVTTGSAAGAAAVRLTGIAGLTAIALALEPGPGTARAEVAAPWHDRGVPHHRTFDLQAHRGVDGLITDYPDRLRTVLADRGFRLPKAYRPHR